MKSDSPELEAFRESFAARVDAYIQEKGLQRYRFGAIIGWSSGSVSAALNQPREKCSEKFILDVARSIPEFADSFAEYRRIEEEGLGVGSVDKANALGDRARGLARRFREIAEEAAGIADDLEKLTDDEH